MAWRRRITGPDAHEEEAREEPDVSDAVSRQSGYSATLLTFALGIVYFAFGMGRAFTESQGGGVWVPMVVTGLAIALLVPFLRYYMRVHGMWRLSRGFAALPGAAMAGAFMALTMVILPALSSAMETWWSFGLVCVVLATLTTAPAQLALSRDPNRYSEVTA